MPVTIPSAITMPIEKVTSSDDAGPRLIVFRKKSWMSGATSTHGLPSLAPSNMTVPIITTSSPIVPASGTSCAAPLSGLRRPSRPSFTTTGESRENML